MRRQPKLSLTLSNYYIRFTHDRNQALNSIFLKYLKALDALVYHHNQSILEAAHFSGRVADPRQQVRYIETRLNPIFDSLEHKVYVLLMGLRRVTFSLTYLSEAEAIARVLPKEIKVHLSHDKVQAAMLGNIRGVALTSMVHYLIQKVKSRYLDAIHYGSLMGGGEEITSRIDRVLRKRRLHTKPKFPKLREASSLVTDHMPEDTSLSLGFVDDAEWSNILDNYLNVVPIDLRSKEFAIDESERTTYGWEIEQEMTDDFVRLTREGKVDICNENGITDFQWVSVIDDRTDDCCFWRDGLTSSEIETQLQGDHSDDDSDSSVPPAHMNCRCDMAPMTDAMPEEPPEDLGDFESWLTPQ